MAPVVDAHHHLLDPTRIDYPFLQFLPQLRRRIDAHAFAAPRTKHVLECPECHAPTILSEGCFTCPACGCSACSI